MAGSSVRVVMVAFLMNLGIAISKFVAFFFTRSTAMLAEGVHSLADTSNQIFLYLGIKKSQKAADDAHPFGYGMEQYIWSFLVAILIFSLGALFSFYEGVHKLLEPENEIHHVEVNLIILGVGVLLEGYSSFVATKEFRKTKGTKSFWKYLRQTKDQVLVTVLFEDFAALIGLFIALIGNTLYLFTGLVIFDSIATILIGVLLGLIAIFLFREAKDLLVGESASDEDKAKISDAFNSHPQVEKLKELLTMHLSANQILVNAHVKFKGGLTLEEVEDIIDEIEEKMVQAVPSVYKIFIETHQNEQVADLAAKLAHGEAPIHKPKTAIGKSKKSDNDQNQ